MSDSVPVTPAEPVETYESLASLIDLHLLDPVLTTDAVAAGCRLARDYRLRAVVVRPCDVEQVSQWLQGSGVVAASVAGYPEGTSTTAAKLYEARDLIRLGAREIEFVLNPARMISRQFQHVETELLQASRTCHESGAKLTVVHNNHWLAEDLKIIGTKICRRVEADVISVEHTEQDLQLLKPLLKDVLRMKHASRVSTLEEALAARDAGYASIASDSPEALLDQWKARIAAQTQPEMRSS